MLLFEKYVPVNKPEFISKVKEISDKLQISPDWLMAIMYHESGLDSTIQNSIGATGLIQFMPATANGLGVSPDVLKRITNVEQLDYVYKYYKPFAGRFKSVYDLFAYSFMPIAVGKPDDWVFQCKGLSAEIIAKQNKIFDTDKNLEITMKEYKAYIRKWFILKGVDTDKLTYDNGLTPTQRQEQ